MKVSELKVMQSAAGYYVGRSYEDDDMPGCEMPYSRESYGYFATAAEAQVELAQFIKWSGGDA